MEEGNEDFRHLPFMARHPAGKPRHIQKQEIVAAG